MRAAIVVESASVDDGTKRRKALPTNDDARTEGRKTLTRRFDRVAVAIDPEERDVGACRQERGRVTAPAERRVDDDAFLRNALEMPKNFRASPDGGRTPGSHPTPRTSVGRTPHQSNGHWRKGGCWNHPKHPPRGWVCTRSGKEKAKASIGAPHDAPGRPEVRPRSRTDTAVARRELFCVPRGGRPELDAVDHADDENFLFEIRVTTQVRRNRHATLAIDLGFEDGRGPVTDAVACLGILVRFGETDLDFLGELLCRPERQAAFEVTRQVAELVEVDAQFRRQDHPTLGVERVLVPAKEPRFERQLVRPFLRRMGGGAKTPPPLYSTFHHFIY